MRRYRLSAFGGGGWGVGCYLRRDTKRVKMLEINNATLRTTLKVSSYNVHAEGLLYGLLYIHYRTDYHKDCYRNFYRDYMSLHQGFEKVVIVTCIMRDEGTGLVREGILNQHQA